MCVVRGRADSATLRHSRIPCMRWHAYYDRRETGRTDEKMREEEREGGREGDRDRDRDTDRDAQRQRQRQRGGGGERDREKERERERECVCAWWLPAVHCTWRWQGKSGHIEPMTCRDDPAAKSAANTRQSAASSQHRSQYQQTHNANLCTAIHSTGIGPA